MKTHILRVLLGLSLISQMTPTVSQADTRHVWEKVEIILQSQRPV